MIELLLYAGLGLLILIGLIALSRPRRITPEQYEEMKGKGSAVGNALQSVQELLEPGRAESLRKAKTEQRVQRDDSGDDK
ncbi:MAG TPA: hypothetical protein VFP98_00675 [Candidatus Polarisedimenticolia bacterium]|nr:hypothetical protein [Candidatus Polarisedimenticolia bacterium]